MRFTLICRNINHGIRARSTTATSAVITEKADLFNKSNCQIETLKPKGKVSLRESVAPWLRIGEYKKGLLSHLTKWDIIRALGVLKLCSFDSLVDRSLQLLEVAYRIPAGQKLMRKTLGEQFVGGETVHEMEQTVIKMHSRGVKLMLVPVLEEDLEDKRSSKRKYDDNLNSILNQASITGELEKTMPIFQLKMSSVMPPHTLEAMSQSIESRCNDVVQYARIVEEIANAVENPKPALFTLKLNEQDQVHFVDGLRRADTLVRMCRDSSVRVLVDAEFYACKRAIATMSCALMARYNKGNIVVGNTIQCYLKDAVPTMKHEFDVVTKQIGVNWYGKVVRGAYIDRERFLAAKAGLAPPTHNSYDDTNNSYNQVIEYILHHIATNTRVESHLVVATHNERSIRLAAQAMRDLGIKHGGERVCFGQVYGMADYLSTPLVNEGYSVYKSTPYGPMESVLPYLSRRASENRSVIKGAREERNMLSRELKSRIFGF